MATHRTSQCSPFTQAVVNCMRKIYPESLADKSFDNTGLLLEAPWNPTKRLNNSVLLTIDLTKNVADEAIKRKDSVIVAYHPIIFRGLKSLTLNDPQQDSLLRLAQEGISVYSPHTAVDAVPGGMADWLCDVVTGANNPTRSKGDTTSSGGSKPLSSPEQGSSDAQQQQPPPLPPRRSTDSTIISHSRTTLYPSQSPPPDFEDAGMGRLVTFATPQPLTGLVNRVMWGASSSALNFPIALPQTKTMQDMTIRTVATCAGSGSSILLKNGAPVADLLITGELSHHEALAVIERGSAVITLFHSNSERGYLRQVLQEKLASALQREWGEVKEEMAQSLNADSEEMTHLLENEGVEVEVSQWDKDPYTIVNAV